MTKVKTIPLLHYELRGSGPTVVLLHGFMASGRYWQRVADTLVESGHTVLALDLLGFGNSPKPIRSRYDYNAQLASINATIDALGIAKPFTLVGHSMGSLISLRYARTYPENIQKLVLTNMPVFRDYKEAKTDILSSNFFYRIGLRPVLHDIIWPLFRIATTLRLLPSKVAEGAVSRRSYIFQSKGYSRLRSMRNVIYSAKIEADLAAIQVATDVISGLNDRGTYLRNIANLPVLKNVRISDINGGHHLPITHPDAILSLV